MSESAVLMKAIPTPSQLYRWLVLIFVSLAMFGNYYVYDSINPLGAHFLLNSCTSPPRCSEWLNASYSVAAVLTL